jgi:secondary thiamine-phosphate synthase enzyme
MIVVRHGMRVASTEGMQFIDVTRDVFAWVRSTGVREGLLTLSSPHTTARVTLNEAEPRLQRDMLAFLEALVPPGGDYHHNQDTVDDRPNAHAHLLGLFMNATETIPIEDGAPALGRWQSIFFVELDGPREGRELLLQAMGTR